MALRLLNEVVQSPSAFDSLSNYIGQSDFPGWFVLLTRMRNASYLEESNWETALKKLGGESDDVVVHRFGHWACGWWEALAVKADTDAYRMAEGIAERLERYPVLDDYDLGEREQEAASDVWRDCYTWRERVEYIREDRSEFAYRSFADLLACVRGKCFLGYASELISE